MTEPTVYLVDDEAAVRRSVSFMLKTAGITVIGFESGEEFLKVAAGLAPGCVLLDVRLSGIDGMAVQQTLRARGIMLPVVIITGHGDVGLAVRAMKAGAVDFIEKPFEKATLLAAIDQAHVHNQGREELHRLAETAQARLNVLTPRERDVLEGLVNGHSNKVVAYDLGISPRTVEIHRANLMSKLAVNSLSDALRIAFTARVGSLGQD
ncbi:response regulator transcription factor [Polymorphobacter fuscus]|uniref:Response regulator n=1 Tax=Sandarakinorhabdus fusca TaxID=1439888 RepID=A0A7C9GVR1_9SPHN|nr:response regulator [Polymorphobacter fuscus]KAB7648675.1 response regulator transcription factor [Polymorphobacter fuscus]MQT16234.1 response regulator [Polymorphobacter fuscus]NJC07481.1 two-component system response regulator FixJ [Polymorphobacter fuscus]